jgi:hypothetical protein
VRDPQAERTEPRLLNETRTADETDVDVEDFAQSDAELVTQALVAERVAGILSEQPFGLKPQFVGGDGRTSYRIGDGFQECDALQWTHAPLFGSPAVSTSSDPWLCVPASRLVCHFGNGCVIRLTVPRQRRCQSMLVRKGVDVFVG